MVWCRVAVRDLAVLVAERAKEVQVAKCALSRNKFPLVWKISSLCGTSDLIFMSSVGTERGRPKFIASQRISPGGLSGAAGIRGNDGDNGDAGLDGKGGRLILSVVATVGGAVTQYDSMFNLTLSGFRPFTSETGIIEPGQKLIISGIKVQNTNRMPVPAGRVQLSLQPNIALHLDNDSCCYILPQINMSMFAPVDLSEDHIMSFKIARHPPNMNNTTLVYDTNVVVRAEMTRIKRYIANFDKVPHPIHVQYPVELSVLQGGTIIAPGACVPLTVKIRNNSLRALGMMAKYPRRLIVNFGFDGEDFSEMKPTFKTQTDLAKPVYEELSLTSQVAFEIDYLAAGGELMLSGTLMLTPSASKVYTSIPVCFSLSLGDIERPTSVSQVLTIQQETKMIKLTEGCKPLTDKNLLIVNSCATTREQMVHWNRIAKALNMSLVVWNVSMYNGFSYYYNKFDLLSPAFKNGLVIFLNVPFEIEPHKAYFNPANPMFAPLQYLNPCEIYEAARYHGIRTYVINTSASSQQPLAAIFPLQAMPCVEIPLPQKGHKPVFSTTSASHQRDECIPQRYAYVNTLASGCCASNTAETFAKAFGELKEKVRKELPGQMYFFKPMPQQHEIEVRRGLDTTHASIAVRNSPADSNHCSDVDLFVVVKLLSFPKKLQLFNELANPLIGDAILSDLADEQAVFFAHQKRYGPIPAGKLEHLLTANHALRHFDFKNVASVQGGSQVLLSLLVRYRFLGSFYRAKSCFSSVISTKKVIRDAVMHVLHSYVKGTSLRQFREMRRKYAKDTFNMNAVNESFHTQVVDTLKDPYKFATRGVQLNHWLMANDDPTITQFTTAVPNTVQTASFITDGSDFQNDAQRLSVMSLYLSKCTYRNPVPQHYPNSEGNTNYEPPLYPQPVLSLFGSKDYTPEPTKLAETVPVNVAASFDASSLKKQEIVETMMSLVEEQKEEQEAIREQVATLNALEAAAAAVTAKESPRGATPGFLMGQRSVRKIVPVDDSVETAVVVEVQDKQSHIGEIKVTTTAAASANASEAAQQQMAAPVTNAAVVDHVASSNKSEPAAVVNQTPAALPSAEIPAVTNPTEGPAGTAAATSQPTTSPVPVSNERAESVEVVPQRVVDTALAEKEAALNGGNGMSLADVVTPSAVDLNDKREEQ